MTSNVDTVKTWFIEIICFLKFDGFQNFERYARFLGNYVNNDGGGVVHVCFLILLKWRTREGAMHSLPLSLYHKSSSE